MLIVAAGRDDVVSTPAIEEFAMRLRAGSHLVVAGAQHEMLMEQDRYPRPVLGRVRRVRAGHAAVLILARSRLVRSRPWISASALQKRHRGGVHAPVAGGDDAAAALAGPPSQVVTMPPAPAMIGISASDVVAA